MSSLSDLIEEYIMNIIELSKQKDIRLKRNDLSLMFSCVPSQINYVIKTRFTMERGYIVESKRGEGGYLRIVKIPVADTKIYLERIKKGSGDYLSCENAKNFLQRLVEENIINKREMNLVWQLLKDESLPYEKEEKGYLRAKMLKNLIGFLVKEEKK